MAGGWFKGFAHGFGPHGPGHGPGPMGMGGPRGPGAMAMAGPPFGPGRGRRGGPWWGGGPGFGGPPHHGRGPRARRGDIRTAILVLLAEEPRNGYGLMQEMEGRSGGVWRPSPGSVYPALQQLEDEGLIRTEERDGRRVFVLTDEGRAVVAARPEGVPAPWDAVSDGVSGAAHELFATMHQVGMAVAQLAQVGNDAQHTAAREVLADARRRLYGILAEDGGDAEQPPPQQV